MIVNISYVIVNSRKLSDKINAINYIWKNILRLKLSLLFRLYVLAMQIIENEVEFASSKKLHYKMHIQLDTKLFVYHLHFNIFLNAKTPI